MSRDDERVHSTEEWNRIDRGEVGPDHEEPRPEPRSEPRSEPRPEPRPDPLRKTDDPGGAPPSGAGSEPPD
jgi:hypothetical protein